MRYILLLIHALLIVSSCQKHEKQINFYHWKTNVSIGQSEKEYVQALATKKVYMRMFDIDDEGNGAAPKGKVNTFDSKQLDVEYIPVVFVTNRTFTKKSDSEIHQLADKAYNLIAEICTTNGIAAYNEIQIDCDWTNGTRYAYFKFLEELKSISGKEVTCTIRLHQVKYRNTTGVPPVDKGYIMCYATNNPSDENVENSILDIKLLKDYMSSINDYPLTFDIALPIYSWAVVTNHLGKIKLINAITPGELDTAYFRQESTNNYRVIKDGFLRNIYLNEGFKLRIESISPQLLDEAKTYLNGHVKKEYAVIYYHLDEKFLKQYSISDLK